MSLCNFLSLSLFSSSFSRSLVWCQRSTESYFISGIIRVKKYLSSSSFTRFINYLSLDSWRESVSYVKEKEDANRILGHRTSSYFSAFFGQHLHFSNASRKREEDNRSMRKREKKLSPGIYDSFSTSFPSLSSFS